MNLWVVKKKGLYMQLGTISWIVILILNQDFVHCSCYFFHCFPIDLILMKKQSYSSLWMSVFCRMLLLWFAEACISVYFYFWSVKCHTLLILPVSCSCIHLSLKENILKIFFVTTINTRFWFFINCMITFLYIHIRNRVGYVKLILCLT